MKSLNEILSKNPVESSSQKIQTLMSNTNSTPQLMLPKNRYEPFFMKIMSDFQAYHKLPNNIPPPQGNMAPHKLLSYIAELMAYSMGEDKRNAIVSELEEYKKDLPFDLR